MKADLHVPRIHNSKWSLFHTGCYSSRSMNQGMTVDPSASEKTNSTVRRFAWNYFTHFATQQTSIIFNLFSHPREDWRSASPISALKKLISHLGAADSHTVPAGLGAVLRWRFLQQLCRIGHGAVFCTGCRLPGRTRELPGGFFIFNMCTHWGVV